MNVSRRQIGAGLGLGAASLLGGLALWKLQALPLAPAVDYVGLDGSKRSSAQWLGQVTLVNFWATSCASCIKEMPMLARTHEKFAARGYQTVAVAMQYDRPDFVVRFAESRKLPFEFTHDASAVLAQAFGDVRLTPTSFLIDRRGQIVKRYVGEPDEKALQAEIEALLKA